MVKRYILEEVVAHDRLNHMNGQIAEPFRKISIKKSFAYSHSDLLTLLLIRKLQCLVIYPHHGFHDGRVIWNRQCEYNFNQLRSVDSGHFLFIMPVQTSNNLKHHLQFINLGFPFLVWILSMTQISHLRQQYGKVLVKQRFKFTDNVRTNR